MSVCPRVRAIENLPPGQKAPMVQRMRHDTAGGQKNPGRHGRSNVLHEHNKSTTLVMHNSTGNVEVLRDMRVVRTIATRYQRVVLIARRTQQVSDSRSLTVRWHCRIGLCKGHVQSRTRVFLLVGTIVVLGNIVEGADRASCFCVARIHCWDQDRVCAVGLAACSPRVGIVDAVLGHLRGHRLVASGSPWRRQL